MRLDLGIPPGATLGRYELLAPIGTGGMATVILARQRGPRGFEKAVVLKVVHPHMAHEQAAIDMLLDEARVAAQISHHNVVQTYELGEADGTYFIAMEYLAGESLSHVLKAATTGAPAPNAVLGARIVADVAAGLHAAHELCGFDGTPLGVIHRDVSPSNVVVLYNGGVKVVDFGIAKANGRVTTTQCGRVKGKYGYMSPEQIRDDVIDRRADVFSLGVVLWETLALTRLFREDNIVATLEQILSVNRVPPSWVRPGVPPALDAVAMKALDVDPARRYQTAAEMKAAIDDAIWQSRCGAGEIAGYMTSLFADRIAERQRILARVATATPRLTSREIEVIGAAFDDTSSLQLNAAPPAPRVVTRATVGIRPPTAPAGLGDHPVAHADTPLPSGLLARPTPRPASVPMPVPAMAVREFFVPPTRRSRRPVMMSWRARTVAVLGASLALAIAAAFGLRGRMPATPPANVAVAAIAADGETALPGLADGGRISVEPIAADVTTNQAPPIIEKTPIIDDKPPDAIRDDVVHANASGGGGGSMPMKPSHAAHGPRGKTSPPAGLSAKELTARGAERFHAGDLAGAEQDYLAAIAADRRLAAAHRGLGLLYQHTGRFEDAIAHLERYLALAPKARDAAAIRARIAAIGGAS
jgi:serine/threonine-protein kinase